VRGYRVELLTPHQGADERGDDLVPLPSIPGLDPSTYVETRTEERRNLFRLPLPR